MVGDPGMTHASGANASASAGAGRGGRGCWSAPSMDAMSIVVEAWTSTCSEGRGLDLAGAMAGRQWGYRLPQVMPIVRPGRVEEGKADGGRASTSGADGTGVWGGGRRSVIERDEGRRAWWR